MSAANHQNDYGPPDTATDNVRTRWPLIVESGTKGSKPYFQFTIWPIESPRDKSKKEPRVKSRWLKKQMKSKGWGKP